MGNPSIHQQTPSGSLSFGESRRKLAPKNGSGGGETRKDKLSEEEKAR